MRAYETKKAAKDTGRRCTKCGEEVVKGQAYWWTQAYRGPKVVKHQACGRFRGSELTANDKLSALYSVQEQVDDWVAGFGDGDFELEDAKTFMSDMGDQADEVAEMYREVQSNIEDGFQHATEQSDEAGDNADQVDDWATALRDCLDGVPEWDPDDMEHLDDAERLESRGEWIDEVTTAMQDASGECPL